MKLGAIFLLGCKNLFNNLSHYILSLISIILLSVTTLSIANFCYYYNNNSQVKLKELIKTEGVDVTLSASGSSMLSIVSIKDFLDLSEKNGILHSYSFSQINLFSEDIPFEAYISNLDIIKGNPTVIRGKAWKEQNKDEVWISETASITNNLDIGDTLVAENNVVYKVAGIVEGNINYLDYSYFNDKISGITVFDNNSTDYSEAHKIFKTIKKATPAHLDCHGTTMNQFIEAERIFGVILGITIFLIVLCLVLSLGSIINTFKISLEHNNFSLGVMRALGSDNKNLRFYILTQFFVLTAIGVVISTVISILIAVFSLKAQLNTVNNFLQCFLTNKIKTGFYFVLPLINLVVMVLTVFLGTFKQVSKLLEKDVVLILKEVM